MRLSSLFAALAPQPLHALAAGPSEALVPVADREAPAVTVYRTGPRPAPGEPAQGRIGRRLRVRRQVPDPRDRHLPGRVKVRM